MAIKTEKGIVIHKMDEAISVSTSWYPEKVPISKEDINEVLPVVVRNLFKLRDGKKSIKPIYIEW